MEDENCRNAAKMMNIKAMPGIDIFRYYDLAIIAKGTERGICLMKKRNKNTAGRERRTTSSFPSAGRFLSEKQSF